MRSRYDISDLVSQDLSFLKEVTEDFGQGLSALADILPAVTIYGSSRVNPGDPIYRDRKSVV